MQPRDLPDRVGREPAQKTTQGGGVGKLLQSDQRNKQAIVVQDLGFVHARQARNDHIEKDQDHVGGVVVGPRGSVSENTLQSAAQAQLLTKPLDQKQTAEVGERVRFERKIQCLQALSHFADNKKLPFGAAPITVQNGRFLARGQNVTFCLASKPFGEILGVAHAFLRFQRREGKLIRTASRQISRFRVNKLGKWTRSLIEDLSQSSSDVRRQNQLVGLAVRRAGEAFAETVERRRAIDFSDLSTIHRTRVAFKKFRYIVESIPVGVTGLTKRDLRTLALYQRRMGNIQDLEVIQATITDLIQRQDGLEGLLAPFCAYLRRRRTRALLSFRKSADELFQFWPSGLAAVRTVPAPPSEAALQGA